MVMDGVAVAVAGRPHTRLSPSCQVMRAWPNSLRETRVAAELVNTHLLLPFQGRQSLSVLKSWSLCIWAKNLLLRPSNDFFFPFYVIVRTLLFFKQWIIVVMPCWRALIFRPLNMIVYLQTWKIMHNIYKSMKIINSFGSGNHNRCGADCHMC